MLSVSVHLREYALNGLFLPFLCCDLCELMSASFPLKYSGIQQQISALLSLITEYMRIPRSTKLTVKIRDGIKMGHESTTEFNLFD